MKSKHLWKISMTVSLPIALAVGDVRGYCMLSNHCHIQILDVRHDLLNGFVSGLPFPSPPSPSKISSTQPLRKAWYSGYIRGAIPLYSPVNLSHPLWFWTFDSLILYITTDKINVEKSKWERVSVANCKFTHGTKLNALEVTCLVC